MIKLENISKVFSTYEIETIALNKVSFKVDESEFLAIMGPSGCGKSTLLNIIGLLDNPDSGNYSFLRQEVSTLSEKRQALLRKENIGFVFQNFNLIDELTVFENVELPLIYLKQKSSVRKKKVMEILEKMKIIHRRNHFPIQLSGGQQQRVAVARAIVTQPKLILADEPTGNLDSSHGEELMNILSDLNKNGSTIIIVTHSQRDADYCQRIIRLFDGKIIHENVVQNQ
ncbi:MAG: ABC transporter ATP-binding protein [Bacteroidetes bacterium]|jgi:putative ABC transport system ATP-binding protein|nr:ABC transporter ATP-binding protein [Bacteroidota bacterium]MBT6685919.1 ABC transporter ATP-binding protein [Bacteroidota bacterium]MBT7143138.1 ABC transporter ATP-binding protein [Bacteroidota bacterium]MBT7491664.1 ABC transporter ATP-binding protein [Bacteroidota bacterium]